MWLLHTWNAFPAQIPPSSCSFNLSHTGPFTSGYPWQHPPTLRVWCHPQPLLLSGAGSCCSGRSLWHLHEKGNSTSPVPAQTGLCQQGEHSSDDLVQQMSLPRAGRWKELRSKVPSIPSCCRIKCHGVLGRTIPSCTWMHSG